MAAGMWTHGRGLEPVVVQAKASVMLALGLQAYSCGITTAAGAEVEGGPGQLNEFVLRQLLCSLCLLLQMFLSTAAGVQWAR